MQCAREVGTLFTGLCISWSAHPEWWKGMSRSKRGRGYAWWGLEVGQRSRAWSPLHHGAVKVSRWVGEGRPATDTSDWIKQWAPIFMRMRSGLFHWTMPIVHSIVSLVHHRTKKKNRNAFNETQDFPIARDFVFIIDPELLKLEKHAQHW